MIDATEKAAIAEALRRHYHAEVMYGKGGWWVKGHGHITVAEARRLTGIEAAPRAKRSRSLPWGDYASIAAMHGKLRG